MNSLKVLLAAASAAALGASANAAVVSIDEFTTDQTASIGSNGDADNVGVTGAGILGSSREVTLTNTDGMDGPLDTIFVASNSFGRFESGASSNGTGIISDFRLDYDGSADGMFNSSGLGGVDLVDGTNDSFFAQSNFVDGSFDFSIQVWDSDSTATSGVVDIDSNGFFFIPFLEFTDIDFTDVTAISIFVNAETPAADMNLDFIRAVSRDDVVIPVPGASLLFGTAIIGVAVARRRRRG